MGHLMTGGAVAAAAEVSTSLPGRYLGAIDHFVDLRKTNS